MDGSTDSIAVRALNGGRFPHRATHADRVQAVIEGFSRIHSKGYRMLYVPMHPQAVKSYVYEHRVVAERKIGRLLRRSEHVHHLNGDIRDNRPENLEVVNGSLHRILHHGTLLDEQVEELLKIGTRHVDIVALGCSTHRVVRINKRLKGEAHGKSDLPQVRDGGTKADRVRA